MRALHCSPGFSFGSLASDLRLSRARKANRIPAGWRTGLTQTYKVGAPSVFVTGIAWVFIVLAALASVAALLRGAEAASLLPGLQLAGDVPVAAGVRRGLHSHLPWLLAVGLVLSVATLASAIGLLLRLDWARRSFIGLLGLAIVANLGGVGLQHELVHGVVAHGLTQAMLPVRLIESLGGLMVASRGMGVLLALLACGLLGWVIRGLMVPSVRQEFA